MAYDTHAAARELQRAGFTEAQVDALVNVTRATASLPDISGLATKADLAELRAELKADKSELKSGMSELRTEMAELRTEIASAKLQAITIILTGTAAITALGTILSKIIH